MSRQGVGEADQRRGGPGSYTRPLAENLTVELGSLFGVPPDDGVGDEPLPFLVVVLLKANDDAALREAGLEELDGELQLVKDVLAPAKLGDFGLARVLVSGEVRVREEQLFHFARRGPHF